MLSVGPYAEHCSIFTSLHCTLVVSVYSVDKVLSNSFDTVVLCFCPERVTRLSSVTIHSKVTGGRTPDTEQVNVPLPDDSIMHCRSYTEGHSATTTCDGEGGTGTKEYYFMHNS